MPGPIRTPTCRFCGRVHETQAECGVSAFRESEQATDADFATATARESTVIATYLQQRNGGPRT